jgi:hypothetical protein
MKNTVDGLQNQLVGLAQEKELQPWLDPDFQVCAAYLFDNMSVYYCVLFLAAQLITGSSTTDFIPTYEGDCSYSSTECSILLAA